MISTTFTYYKEVSTIASFIVMFMRTIQIEPGKEHTSTTFLRFEELIQSEVWLQEVGAKG
jgi:hypothetical protein